MRTILLLSLLLTIIQVCHASTTQSSDGTWSHRATLGWVYQSEGSDWMLQPQIGWIYQADAGSDEGWIFADSNWLYINETAGCLWSLVSANWIQPYHSGLEVWAYDYRLAEWTLFTDHRPRNEFANGYDLGRQDARTKPGRNTLLPEGPFLEGYNTGFDEVLIEAYEDGHFDGFDEGFNWGWDAGYSDGYDVGYSSGYVGSMLVSFEPGAYEEPLYHLGSAAWQEYKRGYDVGEDDGWSKGYDRGHEEGQQTGYDDGYNDAREDYGVSRDYPRPGILDGPTPVRPEP